MKKFLVLLFVSVSIVANAQNVAVWTHQAANTEAFRKGCPGGWPYSVQDIGASSIPADLLARGWKQMTRAELESAKAALADAKEQWNQAQEAAAATPKLDREALIRQAKADLTTIVESSGTLTAAQLSNSVRAMARILRALIEDLGY